MLGYDGEDDVMITKLTSTMVRSPKFMGDGAALAGFELGPGHDGEEVSVNITLVVATIINITNIILILLIFLFTIFISQLSSCVSFIFLILSRAINLIFIIIIIYIIDPHHNNFMIINMSTN